jgi:hypothetical protein
MPGLGITAPGHGAGDATMAALRAIGPAHVRVELVPSLDDVAASRALVQTAAAIGAPLEVALLVDNEKPAGSGADLDRAAGPLRGPELARVLVHRLDGRTTPRSLLEEARDRLTLPEVPFVGGTASHFSELNREPPDPGWLDAIGVAITPQVHATDERSMVETLEVQPQIVAQLHTMTDGMPVVVSPVTLAARALGGPDGIDARTRSAFAGAWTAASVGHLAAAGVAAVTFHERADDTLAELDAASGLTPAGVVLAALGRFRGHEVVRLESTHPRRVFGVVAGVGDTMDALLANLTPASIEFEIEAAGSTVPAELDGFDVRRFEVREGRISEVPLWSLPRSAGPST